MVPVALLALAGAVGYVLVVFVGHPLLLRSRTGSSAWLATLGSDRAEKVANLLFLAGCALDIAGPALVLAGLLRTVDLPIPTPARAVVGVAALVACLALAVQAQRAMAGEWRTGVDPDRPGHLVTTGPFRLVRHPTYTSLLAQSAALGLLVPTPVAALAVLVCLVGLQAQARLVEEPFLRRVHGAAYQAYGARVGRFVPALGRFPRT